VGPARWQVGVGRDGIRVPGFPSASERVLRVGGAGTGVALCSAAMRVVSGSCTQCFWLFSR
jgi:hypothetical protein